MTTGADVLTSMLGLRWTPLSEPCPKCKNTTLQRGANLMSGPYGGQVKCFTEGCDHRESSYGFLGRTMIQVQPMPDGALPFYDKTPTDKD